MADPHNDHLERAENYERLAKEVQDPVLAAAFRRLAGNCRLTAERISELEECLQLARVPRTLSLFTTSIIICRRSPTLSEALTHGCTAAVNPIRRERESEGRPLELTQSKWRTNSARALRRARPQGTGLVTT